MSMTSSKTAVWFSYLCIAAGIILLCQSSYEVFSYLTEQGTLHFSALAIRLGAGLRDLCLVAAGFSLLECHRRAVALGLVVCLLAVATAAWASIVDGHRLDRILFPLLLPAGITFVLSFLPMIFGRRAARAAALPPGQPQPPQPIQPDVLTMRRAARVMGIVLLACAVVAIVIIGADAVAALVTPDQYSRRIFGATQILARRASWIGIVFAAVSALFLLLAAIQALRCNRRAAHWLIRSAIFCAGSLGFSGIVAYLQPTQSVMIENWGLYYLPPEHPLAALAYESAIVILSYAAAYLYLRRVSQPPAARPVQPLPVTRPA